MDYSTRAREILEIEIAGLQKVQALLGAGFAQAVERMLACLRARGKIVVTGIGKNLHIAEKISATLASTGSTSVVLNPLQAMHGDLGILTRGDVLLALSYSGASDELIALVPTIRRLGVEVVTLTGVTDSPLAACSDTVVPVTVDREACPFNMAPTASTTATLAVGDALAMVLLEARGFRVEDYAKLHPGGAIGRALLLRVADFMRTGERLASVAADATVRDAILAMTRARAGSACVVNADGRLAGIFTDGDFRRRIAQDAGFIEAPVTEAMTTSPITVRPDSLAVDALRLFEEHNIDDLPVVEPDRTLAGMVDIQDLPKLKIM